MKNNTSVPKMLKLNVLTLKHFMFFFLKRGETHIKTDIPQSILLLTNWQCDGKMLSENFWAAVTFIP